MGLLDMLSQYLPAGAQKTINPFAQYVDQNRNGWIDGFSGMVGAGNDPRDALTGFAKGLQAGTVKDTAYAAVQKADAEKAAQLAKDQANQDAIKAWIQKNAPQYAGLPAEQAWQGAEADIKANSAASAANDPAEVATFKFYVNDELKAGRKPKSFEEWRAGSKFAAKAGLGTPLPYRDAAGNWHAVEPMNDGTAVDLATGQPPTADLKYDPYGYAGGKTGVVADAKTAAVARQQLPGAEQAYALTSKALNSLIGPTPDAGLVAGEAEQFGNFLGVPQQMTGALPGSHKADFRNIVDQLSGQAFLQIRQALKGAGQVTDFEGQKGELAISRMRAAAEKGSKAEFDQALLDYRDAMENGMRLLREQAQGDYAAGQPAVTGQPGNTTSTGTSWSYSP